MFFRRTALTGALPVPEAGGNVDELRLTVPIKDDSWPLIIGWLIFTLLPGTPVPILFFRGTQGAGKSWTARMLSRLVDPSAGQLHKVPRERDWQAVGAGSRVIAFDNINRIPEWFGDTLCRAVTGEAGASRALYTDSEIAVFSFKLAHPHGGRDRGRAWRPRRSSPPRRAPAARQNGAAD